MIKICFVCHGNICRSPMAEFIMKDIVNKNNRSSDYYIVSRATHTDEIFNGTGNRIYPPAQAELKMHRIPFDEGKRAELLDISDYDKYDLFVCMDGENVRSMSRLFMGDPEGKISKLPSYAGKKTDVSDPWYTRNFERAYRDIFEGCTALYKFTESNLHLFN